MKHLSVLCIVAIAVATVNAGNPSNLRTTGSDTMGDRKEFDFDMNEDDQINQVDQTASSLDGSGSDCHEICPLDDKPVKDKNGVEYPNECLLRSAQCSGNPYLASSDFADMRNAFGNIEGTIELSGSGSTEHVVVDIGIRKIFGVK